LTPWELIEKRVEAASVADFVIVLYNPKSRKRVEGLGKVFGVIERFRDGGTPVGIVRNASRHDETTVLTTLDGVGEYYDSIDMLTILIIGNSQTLTHGPWMITPRGYREV
jgi:precorrin-3B C17-methyltransferase